MQNDFAAFILTHGRPGNVKTYRTLRRLGYTGRIVIVIDDLDSAGPEYVERYGAEVAMFDKKAVARTFDTGDNFDDMRSIVYARNACFDIAERLGIKYFVQLDDDYHTILFKINSSYIYEEKACHQLDLVFQALLDFFIESGADSVAMAQGGDFIGGVNTKTCSDIRLRRKCMNSFFCSTDRRFNFIGRINEDVNTYTRGASTGLLFFTNYQVAIAQGRTQQNSGGMSELYLDSGTYLKSFYSVMFQPSSVKIDVLQAGGDARIHHRIKWQHTTPMIVRQDVQKV